MHFLMRERAHIERPYVSEIYDRSHLWNEIPWSPTLFPAARQECRPRKGAPPRVSSLKIFASAYECETRSLRSLKQSHSLHGGSENFSPTGRLPTERAGSCTSAYLCRASLRTHIPHDCVLSHEGSAPHTLKNFLMQAGRTHIKTFSCFFMPGEVLRRAQARSLMAAYVLMKRRTHIRGKTF